MLRVTFFEPVLVRDKELCNLFALMENPARLKIEQIDAAAPVAVKRGRKPKALETPATTPAEAPAPVEAVTQATAPTEAPKRRGRPPKVVEAAPVEAATQTVPTEAPKRRGRPPKVVEAPATADTKDLSKRFTALVDSNYEAALELLEDFGASSFGEVKTEDYDAFAEELAKAEAETEAEVEA